MLGISYLGDEDSDSSRNRPRISSPILRDESMTDEDLNHWLDAEDSSPGKFVSVSMLFGLHGVFLAASIFVVCCFRGFWSPITQFLRFQEPS